VAWHTTQKSGENRVKPAQDLLMRFKRADTNDKRMILDIGTKRGILLPSCRILFALWSNNAGMLKKIVIFPIRVYQKLLSPLMGPTCRFQPTCSHYMVQSIEEWGILKGLWLGLKRIGRCHPWGGHGIDPVPPNPKKKHSKNQSKESS